MDEQGKKSKTPIIITAVAAVLAVAMVVVLIIVMKKKPNSDETSQDSGFVVTRELMLECQYAANDLLTQNFEVLRLFVFEGIGHLDEPDGNIPEDGIYTIDPDISGRYSSLDDIELLVKSVYTDEAAEKILHNIDGNGLSVYQNRKIQAEADSEPENSESTSAAVTEKEVLGISADFKPDASKRELWASHTFTLNPTSETACELTIYLGGGVNDSTDLSSISEDMIVRALMIKGENGWRFAEFVR